MLKEQTKLWSKLYTENNTMAYPAEYVIRMFKGKFPRLSFRDEGYEGKSILDIGCGDGRHLCFFKNIGFGKIAGTEISQDIVNTLKANKCLGGWIFVLV